MPKLAQLFWGVVLGAADWLAKFLTQKVAIGVAVTAALGFLLGGMYLGIQKLTSMALSATASMSPMFAAGVGVVISPTTQQFVSSYVAFWSACELYKWKTTLVQAWSRTS